MVRKIFGIIFFLLIMVVPTVLAIDTDITVITKLHHDVTINVLNIDDELLEDFVENSEGFGKVTVTFSSSESRINLVVIVRKDGKIITRENLGNKQAGSPILINLEQEIEEEEEPELNETEEIVNETSETEGIDVNVNITEEGETLETEEEIEEEKRGITGAIVGGGKAIITSKITYFVIIGIIVVGLIIFIVKKKIKIPRGKYIDFKIKDGKDKKEEFDEKIESHDERLEDAEKKLEEAKTELDEIKNRKSKLQEAREKFEKDKKELERLEED